MRQRSVRNPCVFQKLWNPPKHAKLRRCCSNLDSNTPIDCFTQSTHARKKNSCHHLFVMGFVPRCGSIKYVPYFFYKPQINKHTPQGQWQRRSNTDLVKARIFLAPNLLRTLDSYALNRIFVLPASVDNNNNNNNKCHVFGRKE